MAALRRCRFLLFALCCAASWRPSPGHVELPLWPHSVPDAISGSGPEDEAVDVTDHLVAGRPWVAVSNVVHPTITVYPPKGRSTRAAVVVFPGGGYTILAIDLEGTEVCDWLTSKGLTCVLLKYRVPGVQYYPKPAYPKSGPYPFTPIALEDAQRAVGLVRFHAAEWNIDPHKIGVIGFSAGGHLVAAISTHFQKRIYPPVDRADEESCRPDFGILLYPGHISVSNIKSDARFGHRQFVVPPGAAINPDIKVTRDTPPSFVLQAEDDHVDGVDNALSYYSALKSAGVPAELHIYPHGGHAFALRRTKEPITAWPELVEKWLASLGVIPK